MVRFEGKYVKTLSGFKEPRRVRILFEESFYNERDQTYRVLCLERPLEGGKLALLDTQRQVTLHSFESCRQYLIEHPVYQKHIKEIGESLFTLKNSYVLLQDSLGDTVNACTSIFTTLLSVGYSCSSLPRVFFFSSFFLFSLDSKCSFPLLLSSFTPEPRQKQRKEGKEGDRGRKGDAEACPGDIPHG